MTSDTKFGLWLMSAIAYVALFVGLFHAVMGAMTWWSLATQRTPIDAEYVRQVNESTALLLGGLAVALLSGILYVLLVMERSLRRP